MAWYKICYRCKVEQPIDMFYKDSRRPDGFRSTGKCCDGKRKNRWKSLSKDRQKRYAEETKCARKGITVDQYYEALEAQGNRCAICGGIDKGKKLAIDHDHACCPGDKACGQCFRGLLCSLCNQGLAHFHDNPNFLRSAADYLESSD